MKATLLKLLGVALSGAVFALAKHFGLSDASALGLSSMTGGSFAAGVMHPTPGSK